MFVLCATRLARRGILLVLGLAIIGYGVYSGIGTSSWENVPAALHVMALGLWSGFRGILLRRIFHRSRSRA